MRLFPITYKVAHERQVPEKRIASYAMEMLLRYDWPGNVRELENCIESAFTLADDEISTDALPPSVRAARVDTSPPGTDGNNALETLEEVEQSHILETLERCDGDKNRAARLLGIDLSTLYRKLHRYRRA